MKQVERRSISEQVFESLKEQIVKGKWAPGTKIPSENQLTEMLGVSRISLRESLQKLATLGLLESRQGEGTYVKKFSAENYMNTLLPYFVLDKPDTINVLEYRKIVEVGTIGLAVERANQDDLLKLEDINKRMKANINDSKKFANEDLNFHIALAEITRNPVIIKVNYIIRDVLDSSMEEIVNNLGTRDGIYYHEKILAAMKEKDKDKAQQLMEEHVMITINRISEKER